MIPPASRLRKHADYQRVYKTGRRRFSKRGTYFFLLRSAAEALPTGDTGSNVPGARVGLTVSKAMGKAVDRNRIKRRMRAAVRGQIPILSAHVDVVLHPNRSVIDLEFRALEREVSEVFQAIQQATQQGSARQRPRRPERGKD
jgi:ribonuclease P protein component